MTQIIQQSENQMNIINDIIDDGNKKTNRVNKAENDIEYLKNIVSTMTDQ